MTSSKDNTEDSNLFRQSVGSVRPIKQEPRNRVKKSLAVQRQVRAHSHSPKPLNISLFETDKTDLDYLEPLDTLDHSISRTFIRSGLQHRTLKQLRRGTIPLEDTLDLHGATAIQAKKKLDTFIAMSRANQYRAISIVHGKGIRSENNTPVLKTRVNYWLRENENVMGFCPAAPHHGGNGALYVLLKYGKNKYNNKTPRNNR
ncbi:MAG TPA: hypothetical protein ENJ32_04250 [Crenotrichaceae bacterium]|nr:hypothetical protein [Crenotrichaceae bacterium]